MRGDRQLERRGRNSSAPDHVAVCELYPLCVCPAPDGVDHLSVPHHLYFRDPAGSPDRDLDQGQLLRILHPESLSHHVVVDTKIELDPRTSGSVAPPCPEGGKDRIPGQRLSIHRRNAPPVGCLVRNVGSDFHAQGVPVESPAIWLPPTSEGRCARATIVSPYRPRTPAGSPWPERPGRSSPGARRKCEPGGDCHCTRNRPTAM